jgi:hypothetical protein
MKYAGGSTIYEVLLYKFTTHNRIEDKEEIKSRNTKVEVRNL